jgi:hypothetical protein
MSQRVYWAASAVALIGLIAPASGQTPDPAQVTAAYAQMCVTNAGQIPAPMGDGDLKDSPKLGAYCKCFGAKFAARALKAMAELQANPTPDPKSAPPLSQSIAEEREMRFSAVNNYNCRPSYSRRRTE